MKTATTKLLWFVPACVLLLQSCAPSPLYTARPPAGAVTSGEVPRNSLGIPVWSAIKPVPAYAANGPIRYSDSLSTGSAATTRAGNPAGTQRDAAEHERPEG